MSPRGTLIRRTTRHLLAVLTLAPTVTVAQRPAECAQVPDGACADAFRQAPRRRSIAALATALLADTFQLAGAEDTRRWAGGVRRMMNAVRASVGRQVFRFV